MGFETKVDPFVCILGTMDSSLTLTSSEISEDFMKLSDILLFIRGSKKKNL